jgi:hypothetical protein
MTRRQSLRVASYKGMARARSPAAWCPSRAAPAASALTAYLAEIVGVVSRPLAEGEGWSAQEFGHGVHA